jgi:hypothetical protein
MSFLLPLNLSDGIRPTMTARSTDDGIDFLPAGQDPKRCRLFDSTSVQLRMKRKERSAPLLQDFHGQFLSFTKLPLAYH